ncbi:hypothetical protein DAPPUDRAFT_97041 [Daphnia pulex]|uniref:Uncharacterized protein n=1 Tax=Daphnia pulex TaxID=6669 RepID=E9G0E2_DAPPU|nr:hypothetical protein DAPPUDRAFT_97041 [Daphnia pulex]|eukprot:EFX87416.1 hypothetical protein DAPPUDRAFT_97041 [Daphnia pulex]
MVAACWIAGGIGWWFDSDSDDNSYLSDLVSCVMGACDKRDEIVQFKLCLTKNSTFRRAGQFACPSRLKLAGNILTCKTVNAVLQRLGENWTCCIIIKQVDVTGDGVYKNQYQNEYQMAEPCGYCTCLIMMQHVQFSPNLCNTALTVLHVNMFPASFKREGHANWPARLKVEFYNGN